MIKDLKYFTLIFLYLGLNIHIFSQNLEFDFLQKALQKCKSDTCKFNKLHAIGDFYRTINKFDSADYYYFYALKTAEKIGKPDLIALTKIKQARILSEKGQYDSAIVFLIHLIDYCKQHNLGKQLAKSYIDIGNSYDFLCESEKALQYYDTALLLSRFISDDALIAETYNRIGIIYEQLSDFEKALQYYTKALELLKPTENYKELMNCYNYIGIAHFYLGNYQKALEYYQQSQLLCEKYNYKNELSLVYGNIGIIYEMMKDYDRALAEYRKALAIQKELNSMRSISNSYTNIGDIMVIKKEYDSAMYYYKKVIKIAESLNDIRALSFIYTSIGNVLAAQMNYSKAIHYFDSSIVLSLKRGDSSGMAWNYYYMAEIYIDNNQYEKAFSLIQKTYQIGIKIKEKELIAGSAKKLANIFQNRNDYKNAFNYLRIFILYKDSLMDAEKIQEIANLEHQYKFNKAMDEQRILQQEKELNYQKKLTAQKTYRNTFILAFVFMIILSFFIFRNLRQKQKNNEILTAQKNEILQKNEELEQMNHEISIQNHEIVKQNSNITDSIKYAQKIQAALFPQPKILSQYFPEYFLLHKPLNIVSGDFLWVKYMQNKICIAVADCTGHGVPGAFMSVLGIAYLNEISRDEKNNLPAQILHHLQTEIKASLISKTQAHESNDGMDIAICTIEPASKIAQFSGANNHLYLIRDKEIRIIKGSPYPIGMNEDTAFYKDTNISLQKNDMLYMFTDGYVDQFGGKDNRKFMSKNFKLLLQKISSLPAHTQKQVLDETLQQWQGKQPQIDDILVFGIRI